MIETQEHERVVSGARISMSGHDSAKPLHRWFDNYKDDKTAFLWGHEWVVIARDGWRWKIETGPADSDTARRCLFADPAAPAPPLFEFRPPKPEPVKPRMAVPPPMRVPSAMEYIQRMLNPREMSEFMHHLNQRRREEERRYRPARYMRWDDPIEAMMDIRQPPSSYGRPSEPSDRDLMALAHMILDRQRSWRAPPPQAMPPPPTPTRRNQ